MGLFDFLFNKEGHSKYNHNHDMDKPIPRNGHASYTFSDFTYIGNWKDGLMHGEGKEIDKYGGLIKAGYWNKGHYIGESQKTQKFNNDSIRTAVKEWLENSKEAEVKYGHISDWDVSNVTDMNNLFFKAKEFDEPLNKWDVSNVKYMGGMFEQAHVFNQPLDKWDVSNVINMSAMFSLATLFNQDLHSWNVSNVTEMTSMFGGAYEFNQELDKWDVSNVRSMNFMFASAESFNQDISKWDVSNVADMSYMFSLAASFNQDISKWDVRKVENLSKIFDGATSFDKEIKWFFKDDISPGQFIDTNLFVNELKKYIDSHNDTAEINVYTSGVYEEFVHIGKWNKKSFTMEVMIPLKNAEYYFSGSLTQFIEQIGSKRISELNDEVLEIDHSTDEGGSYEIKNISWDPKLTIEEENELDIYSLIDFGFDYPDDEEVIFEKGCIYEIEVKIGDNTISLIK